ncbi:MAG: T9SS type A sorting domain-containing protein [Bacteroidales bacterium]|nr:T9SS type A sorting domain-containing protein [Bacteroidales bacterium]
MKKLIAILYILLTTAYCSLAQDTITGVVNRIAAPYFEQNVCDTRFAITTDSETYYVMIDNYWPNPYLEDLVIHYDTIAIGNEISVVGNILEMEDGNGDVFRVIDIQELVDAEYLYYNSRICWMGWLYPISYPGSEPIDAYAIFNESGNVLYYVSIDGELQTDFTWIVNGVTINCLSQYIFVGTHEIWTDYYGEPFPVFNLKLAIPYSIATDSIDGTLTLSEDLPMDVPCLSVYDGTENFYLTINGVLKHSFINPDLYAETTPVNVGGVETIRYDLFGRTFKSFEIAELQTIEEKTLSGRLQDAPNPAIGLVPLPGMELAFYSGGRNYYLDNERIGIGPYGDTEAIIVGNDTLTYGMELTASMATTMEIDNGFEPYYHVYITAATITTGVPEFSISDLHIFPNPSNGIISINSEKTMEVVYVYDSLGQIILKETICSNNITIDLQEYKGLAIIQIVFENGQALSRKIVVH